MISGKIILLWVGCAGASFGAWNTYHGGAALRGVSETAIPGKLELLWRYPAGGAVYNTPVSDGLLIFFSAKKGALVAVDLEGSKVWEKRVARTNDAGAEVSVQFEAPLACGGGVVLAGSTRGVLYALEAQTGEEKWRYDTGGIIVGSPNFLDARSVVVVDQSDGALHGIDLKTGTLLWKTEGVERCDGSPGIGNERIVFGSCAAALHIYGASGKHLKDIEVGGDGQIAGGVALDGSLAFSGTRDGNLLCVDLEKGDVVWSSDESEEQTFSTPAVTGAYVIYSSENGGVYAVNQGDGELVWKFDTGGTPSSPVVAKERVAVSADGVLFVLNLADGTKLWSQEVSDEITPPGLIGGMIVVGADDGTVSAFGAKE